jgi:hypothetical protein
MQTLLTGKSRMQSKRYSVDCCIFAMDIAEKTVEGYWRRGSESNRRPRLCRPLHNHSATPPLLPQPDGLVAPLQCSRETKKLKRENGFSAKAHELHTMALCERIHFPCNWSGKRGSNSRPQPWQGCALPLSYSREIQSRHYKDAGIFVKKAPAERHPPAIIYQSYPPKAYESSSNTRPVSRVSMLGESPL